MDETSINYGNGSVNQPVEQPQEEISSETPEVESHEDPESPHEEAKEESLSDLPLPGDDGEKKKEIPKWVEKRISKKDRELQQKDHENAVVRAELERLRAAQAQSPQSQQNNFDPAAPKKENYANEDEYIDARIEYNHRKNAQKAQVQQQQQQMANAENEFRSKLNKALESGAEQYDDFEEKTDILFKPGFPPNRAMAEAIVDSDHHKDILYFLGTYPAEAEKIARMNPVQAIKKIAELERRFVEKKKPNITKAPPLIPPVNTSKGGSSYGDPNKMDQNDFENWYKNQVARKA